MPAKKYQFIYDSALKAKSLEKLKEMLKNIDINTMHEGLTAAEALIDSIPLVTPSTPASRKLRDDLMSRVAWLHELGADVNKLARRYAMKGLYQQANLYREQYHADEEQIAIGYVYGMTNYGEKVRAYEAKYGAVRFGIPMVLMLKGYAKADSHSHQSSNKVKDYINEFETNEDITREEVAARVQAVAENYDAECDALSCSDIFDAYNEDFLLGRLASAVRRGAPQKEIEGYIDSKEIRKEFVALVYLQMDKDAEAEKYVPGITTLFQGVGIKESIKAYAEGGHYVKVDNFLSKVSVNNKEIAVASAIQGFINSGDHAKVEEYRIKYDLSFDSIAKLYKNSVNLNGKDFLPPLYKTLIFLNEQGKAGESIIASMLRLKKGQDNHYNPYWMNSGKKLNLIMKAVLEVSEKDEGIAEHVTKTESPLYKALNYQRITLDFAFKEAKTATGAVKAQKDEELKSNDGNKPKV